MTRIDFYLLPGRDPYARRVTACRIVEKAFRQGHAVYLKTGCEEETRVFDDLLWTFRQGSFVPHELVGTPDAEAPVLIGHGEAPERMRDVLVNVSATVPADYAVFERVAELVDQDEGIKLAGRQRYKHYQAEGDELATHSLDRTD